MTSRRLATRAGLGALLAAAALLYASPPLDAAATTRPPARYVAPRYVYIPPPPDYRAPVAAALGADQALAGTYRAYVAAALDANGRAGQAVLDAVGGDGLRLRQQLAEAEVRVARLDGIRDRLAAADAALAGVSGRAAAQAAVLYGRPLEDGQADAAQLGADTQAAAAAAMAAVEEEAAAALDYSLGPLPAPRFAWPEAGHLVISQGWGPSDLLGEPAFAGFDHFHLGLDLAQPEGTVVAAAADGVVVATTAPVSLGRFMGFGNMVLLAHGGQVETIYGHLDEVDVRAGDVVRAGQRIGLEGSTGYSTGPHLHFEVHAAGRPVDPSAYLPSKP